MSCWEHTEEQAEALFDEAIRLAKDHKYLKSINILSHLLEDHLDSVDEINILQEMGSCSLCLEQYETTISHLKRAWELRDDHVSELTLMDILTNLSAAYSWSGKSIKGLIYFDLAEQYFSSYTGQEWTISRFHFRLRKGGCYFDLKRYEESLEEFLKAELEFKCSKSKEELHVEENFLNYVIFKSYVLLENIKDASIWFNKVDLELLNYEHHDDYYIVLIRLYSLKQEHAFLVSTFKTFEEKGIPEYYKSQAHLYVGIAHYWLGDRSKAKRYLNLVLNDGLSEEWEQIRATEYLGKIEISPIEKLINYIKQLF